MAKKRGRPRKSYAIPKRQGSATRHMSSLSTKALLNPRYGIIQTAVNAVPAAKRSNTTVFPMTMICRHKYAQTFVLNATATNTSTATFSLNSLNNPCFAVPTTGQTVSQHQPIGYDQMTALYNNYKVLKASVTARPVSLDARQAEGNSWITLQGHDNSSYSPLDITLIIERGLTSYKLLGPTDGGATLRKLKFEFDYRKMFPGRALDDGLTSTVGGNPTEQYFCSVAQCTVGNSIDPAAILMLVVIDYVVEWSSPIQIDRS